MAKVRVYELAKELGVESKVVLAKLQDMGEFVRSASSTVEAPVVRRLKEVFPARSFRQRPSRRRRAPRKRRPPRRRPRKPAADAGVAAAAAEQAAEDRCQRLRRSRRSAGFRLRPAARRPRLLAAANIAGCHRSPAPAARQPQRHAGAPAGSPQVPARQQSVHQSGGGAAASGGSATG